jgi:hypothetical protein
MPHKNRVSEFFAAILAHYYDLGHLLIALMLRNIPFLRVPKPLHHIHNKYQIPSPPTLHLKPPKLLLRKPFILPNPHKKLTQKLELLPQALKLNIKIPTRPGQIPIQIQLKRVTINPVGPIPKHCLNPIINFWNLIITLCPHTDLIIPIRVSKIIFLIQKRISLGNSEFTNLSHRA